MCRWLLLRGLLGNIRSEGGFRRTPCFSPLSHFPSLLAEEPLVFTRGSPLPLGHLVCLCHLEASSERRVCEDMVKGSPREARLHLVSSPGRRGR